LGNDKALKSGAMINRRSRDEEVLLHLFFMTINARRAFESMFPSRQRRLMDLAYLAMRKESK
jgi:hypothetical protein